MFNAPGHSNLDGQTRELVFIKPNGSSLCPLAEICELYAETPARV